LVQPRIATADILKIKIIITHHSEEFLKDYETKDSPKSKNLWDTFSEGIKNTLCQHYKIDIEVYLEGWENGSVIIKLSLENINASNLQDIKRVVYDQVVLVLPTCNVEIILPSVVKTNMKHNLYMTLNIKTFQTLSSVLLDEVEIVAKKEAESFINRYHLIKTDKQNESNPQSNLGMYVRVGGSI